MLKEKQKTALKEWKKGLKKLLWSGVIKCLRATTVYHVGASHSQHTENQSVPPPQLSIY